jgi:hypothetical protein
VSEGERVFGAEFDASSIQRLVRWQTDRAHHGSHAGDMKWAGMYLFGFLVLVGALLAALWKLGVLERIGTAWTLIGVAVLLGIGIMIAVTNSGRKDNIEIDNK